MFWLHSTTRLLRRLQAQTLPGATSPMHKALGPQLIIMKNSKWVREHYTFMPEMLNFLKITTYRLMTISVCHILGGAWWVLKCILDIKGGLERNHMFPLYEVYWSFWKLKVYQNFGRHLVVDLLTLLEFFKFFKFKFRRLQEMFQKLPLGGRPF